MSGGAMDALATWLSLAFLLVAPLEGTAAAAAEDVPGALRRAAAGDPRLEALLRDPTFTRRVESTGRVLDRDLHEFLLSRPDIGAALARLQGLGEYRVRRTGPRTFEGTDGEGAFAVLRVLDEAPGRRVFHARGRAVLRFFPDVSGEALVLLLTRYEEGEGGDLAHGQLTVYARLDNGLIGSLLKLLIPLVGWVLDSKIARAFLSESRAVGLVARDPEAVLARLVAGEPELAPDLAAFRAALEAALARHPAAGVAAAREPAASPWGPRGALPDQTATEHP